MQFYPSLPTFSSEDSPWLERLITWSSVCSGKDHLEGRLFLLSEAQKLYQDLGAEVEILEKESAAPILVAKLHPKSPKQLLLFGHLDTVFGKDHPFQKVWIEENRLRGPGVCDMKSGVLIMYEAVKRYVKEKSDLGFTIVLNTDEEIGSPISGPLWELFARGHFCALGFEPTFSNTQTPRGFITSRMGSCNLVVTFKGKSAHAGRNPKEGASALSAACNWWSEVESKYQNTENREGLFFNLGRMEGGTASNVVADYARLEINIRSQNETLLADFMNTLSSCAKPFSSPLSMEIQITSKRPAKPATSESLHLAHLALDLAHSLQLPSSLHKTAGVCDGNNIQAYGLPTLDNLGALGAGLHSDQEWIDLPSVDDQITLVTALFERLATLSKL